MKTTMIDITTHQKKDAALTSCKRCAYLTYDEEAVCEKCRELDQKGGSASFSF